MQCLWAPAQKFRGAPMICLTSLQGILMAHWIQSTVIYCLGLATLLPNRPEASWSKRKGQAGPGRQAPVTSWLLGHFIIHAYFSSRQVSHIVFLGEVTGTSWLCLWLAKCYLFLLSQCTYYSVTLGNSSPFWVLESPNRHCFFARAHLLVPLANSGSAHDCFRWASLMI